MSQRKRKQRKKLKIFFYISYENIPSSWILLHLKYYSETDNILKWGLPSDVQRPDNSPSTVKKCYIWSSTVKKFQGVSNLTISANLDGIPAPKEFLN